MNEMPYTHRQQENQVFENGVLSVFHEHTLVESLELTLAITITH